MGDESAVPTYEELRNRTDAPPGSSWRVFGPDDHLGTLNFLTPERIVAASGLIRRGAVFNLDYELNAFMPLPHPTRRAAEHHIFSANPNHRDDWVDGFHLQSTSQIDGLRHMRHHRFGFYAGVPDDRVVVGTPDIGMSLVAEHGIVGRGILLDAERYFAGLGRPLVATETYRITPADLDAIAAHQRTAVQKGDIVLLRTGWSRYFLALSPEERMRRSRPDSPGLDASQEMLEWLWDHNVSVIAADNTGVEAGPIKPGTEFWDPEEPPPPAGSYNHNGTLHRPLISLLGFHLGELWLLDDLARDCSEDWCYEFFLVAKPLNLLGAVGSPPNALAIK